MRDVAELVEAVDLAVARASGVAPHEATEKATERARMLRTRRGFAGESLVLAIAGGTGSGKSSLLNAIAGEPIASVSHLRPHTDEPLAWLPEAAEPGLRVLLDDMRITRSVTQEKMPGLALIDLPDLDSIVEWHRRTVEELLPRVDGVIWLFDPEKYHDRSLHEDFLRPLAVYREQFTFVLNKIDRLPDGAVPDVTRHLASILDADGHRAAPVMPVAAAPVDGPPRGIEELASYLGDRLDAKRMAVGKVIADAEQLLRALGHATGLWNGGGAFFTEQWRRVAARAVEDLAAGPQAAARENALCQIEDLVAAVAVEIGDEFGDRLRRRLPKDRIEAGVDAAAAARPTPPAVPRSRWRRKETASPPDTSDVARLLEEHIGAPLRDLLWDRAQLGATITYAAVGARQLRARLMPD